MNDTWNIPDWDEWFMRMVYIIASKSKDRSSKIGAVIVNNNQIVKVGYNGFPMGVDDDIAIRHDRPLKYSFVSHAESNAIFFAARDGAKTDGCSMYTNGLCCVECAKAVIQSGIKNLIYHRQFQDKWNEFRREKWDGHNEITTQMFLESNVKVIQFDRYLDVKSMIDGKIITV